MLERRAFLKWGGALPLFGAIAADALWQRARAAAGKLSPNVYACVARANWSLR
jgi:hypothetical protein